MKQKLSKKEAKNFNKSDTKASIINYLQTSVLYLHHLLQDSERLAEKKGMQKLVDIINAQSFDFLIENTLQEFDKPQELKQFKHDFKTTELGRTYASIGLDFLRDTTKNEKIHQSIDTVLQFYKDESYRLAEDEAHSKHGNAKDKALTRKREKQLQTEQRTIIKKENRTKKERERYDEIQKELSKKYDHLKPFYCMRDFLSQFKHDMIKNHRRKISEQESYVIFPNIKELPKELCGRKIPMWLATYVQREIQKQRLDLEYDIENLEERFLNLLFFKKKS